MSKPRPSKEDEEESPDGGWKSWARDIAIAVIIMAVLLGAIYAYTGIWPPLVVVESSSMQHSNSVSSIGVIDTGDLVFVQAAPARSDVVTYLEGRASGYSTYGDYGDVIVFRIARDPTATPIIHRAIMYLVPNGTSLADVPDLARLPASEWQGYRNGLAVSGAYGLSAVTIHEMGWQHDLGITFNLAAFMSAFGGHAGYVTMGDNNAYNECRPSGGLCTGQTYDTGWFPSQGDIIGHARGEIPWFGLIKLLLSPASTCCQGWGDPGAPANSWSSLALAIVFLVALPFIVEGAAWGWSKYAWPWLKPRIRRKPPEEPAPDLPTEDEDAPKEGSSGP